MKHWQTVPLNDILYFVFAYSISFSFRLWPLTFSSLEHFRPLLDVWKREDDCRLLINSHPPPLTSPSPLSHLFVTLLLDLLSPPHFLSHLLVSFLASLSSKSFRLEFNNDLLCACVCFRPPPAFTLLRDSSSRDYSQPIGALLLAAMETYNMPGNRGNRRGGDRTHGDWHLSSHSFWWVWCVTFIPGFSLKMPLQ